MATLTEVSFLARRGIKFGAIGLVIIMLIPGIWGFVRQLYANLNPPPPPPPTVRYGKLPQLVFPAASSKVEEYKLETITGGLPADLPNVAKVFVVPINKSRLLTLERYRSIGERLGFANEPIALNEQTYRFFHPTLNATMQVDIISGSLKYNFDWTTDARVYTARRIPLAGGAVEEAKNFFRNLGILETDLAGGQGKYTYWAATGSAMVPVDQFRVEEANFVRVDLFRAAKEKLEFVTAGGDTAPVSVIISGLEGQKRVVQANYYYSKVTDTEFATYPLKGVAAAWDELVKGGGYVAKPAGDMVTVRKASLAYYEANEPQDFLQPVYVFEGDGGFKAIVAAIEPTYVQQVETEAGN